MIPNLPEIMIIDCVIVSGVDVVGVFEFAASAY
jgi:hypothetical protein